MARASAIQTNFTAGELSPRLLGRVDIAKYANGAGTLENMLVMPHGGASRRPGTRFVAETKDSSKTCRLVPFQFSTEQAYILEFGDQYIRFYMDQGRIMSSGSPYEIASPYLESELPALKFVQSADVMYIVHPLHPPMKLARTGHTAWTITILDPIMGPLLPANADSASTVTASADTGSGITLTAAKDIFYSGHVGSNWRIKNGYIKVMGYTDSKHVTADVIYGTNLGTSGSPTDDWAEAALSGYRGYPSAIGFFEERLVFAGSSYQPQTIWLSMSGSYEDFTPGTADDSPMTITLAADQVNAIKWLVGEKVLLIGTTGGEWTLSSGSLGEPLTPTNIQAKREGTHGSAGIPALQVQNSVLYVQRAGRKAYRLAYDYKSDGYLSDDITLLAEHITSGGLTSMAYAQAPDGVLWAVRADGILLAMTYLGAQDVIAWQRLITDGDFESVAVIPADTRDETWVVVKRTINGATKRYVEFFEDPDVDDQEDLFYVDSGLTYDGSPAQTISGLDHLVGKTVSVLADGAVHPDCTVNASGQITLQVPANKVHAGLSYISTVKTLPLASPQAPAAGRGLVKRIYRAIVGLYKSLGMEIGPDENSLETVPFRTTTDDMDTPPPLFTGTKEVIFPAGYDLDAIVMIRQAQPLPLTVTYIVEELEMNER